jgi:hypothetical protein
MYPQRVALTEISPRWGSACSIKEATSSSTDQRRCLTHFLSGVVYSLADASFTTPLFILYPTLICCVLSYPNISYPFIPHPILSYPTLSDPVRTPRTSPWTLALYSVRTRWWSHRSVCLTITCTYSRSSSRLSLSGCAKLGTYVRALIKSLIHAICMLPLVLCLSYYSYRKSCLDLHISESKTLFPINLYTLLQSFFLLSPSLFIPLTSLSPL